MADARFPYLDELRATLSRIDELDDTIDKSDRANDHAPMTDLTRQEVDAKLAQNKAEVEARLANFDTSVKTGFADLRAEFAGLRTEIANMRTDTAKQNHESLKWIIGSIFAMLSISVAIIGVMINFSKAGKDQNAASAPIAQAAPMVLAVPAGTTVLNPAAQAPVATPQTPTK